MKFYGLSSLYLLATASLASAGCYNGGIDGDRGYADTHIYRMCDFLQGHYDPRDVKYHCLNFDSNSRWDFYIENLRDTGNDMGWPGCVEFMLREIDHCAKGGSSSYSEIGWKFTADPNEGKCKSNDEL